MTDREIIISRALKHAVALLGADYSKTYRYRYYKTGSFDCSSFQASNYLYAGYPLLDEHGSQLLTSCNQVYAEGFDLVYPAHKADIGKKLPSSSKLCTTYGAQPGDLVFFNFDTHTSRANKITHIAMVYDKDHYIHTANPREKCCKVPITWGATHICAIIRLKADVKIRPFVDLTKASVKNIDEKRLQIALNIQSVNPRLNCDGQFGSGTESALNAFKKSVGLPANGVCDAATWNMLYGITAPEVKQYIQVLAKAVNVRSTGKVESNNRLGTVKAGQKFLYIGKASSGWYQIDWNGRKAFISNRSDLTKVVK